MQRTLGVAIGTLLLVIATASPGPAASAAVQERYVSANAWSPLAFDGCGFREDGRMVVAVRDRSDVTSTDWAFSTSSCLVEADACPKSFVVCFAERGTVRLSTPNGDIFGTFTGVGDTGYTFSWNVSFTGGTESWRNARGRATVTGGRVFGGTITSSSSWTFIGLRP
jgi:hypothetical protein